MAAHRARRAAPALASPLRPAAPMGRVYECPGCGEPVAVAELVGQGHPDADARPPRSGALAAGSGPSGGGRGITEEDAPM